jgi:hypothetical protein
LFRCGRLWIQKRVDAAKPSANAAAREANVVIVSVAQRFTAGKELQVVIFE